LPISICKVILKIFIIACDHANYRNNFNVPIYGIFCDGSIFEFFKFHRVGSSPDSSLFSCGTLACRKNFFLAPPEDGANAVTFIRTLRPICEIIFDLLLSSYVDSLHHYLDASEARKRETGHPRKSLTHLVEAIDVATESQAVFREADAKREATQWEACNQEAERAMTLLEARSVGWQFTFIYIIDACLSLAWTRWHGQRQCES